ncbi:TPA: RNA-binding cell elongation regulator Jag/EloR [Streptococcus suis]
MEHSTTVRAETVDKAVNIALTKLGLKKDQVSINIINEGKRGLFGFGKQDAIVQVSAINGPTLNNLFEQDTVVADDQADLGANQADSPLSPIGQVGDDSVRGSLDIEEKATDDSHNDTSLADAEYDERHQASQEVEIIQGKETDYQQTEDIDFGAASHTNSAETFESNQAFEQEYDDEVQESTHMAQHQAVAAYLKDVIGAYGADAEITVETSRNQVVFNIETEKSGLIIGKHGKIINALQVLAQVMVHQYDKRRQSVILNIGDYRDRRASVLEQIAERTAREVLRTKRQVVLDPLPSYERKQIHAYLAKMDHIETHSEGKDPNRYLVVEYRP